MNKRQVIILWVIAIVLAAAVAAVKFSQKDTTESAIKRAPGQTLFASFPAADVAAVEIQGASESVTLAKKDNAWIVSNRDAYPAKTSSINDFLRTLAELKVTRGMEAGPSFAPRFGMDESSSTPEEHGLTATFKDASGKEIAKISLGKNIESGADPGPYGGAMSVGRYIRNHADESAFYAASEMFPSVSADATRWLSDDFISPEKIKSISVSQKDKEDIAWKVTRETEEAEFKLEGAAADEVLDTTAASPLKNLFSYARFEDVVPADKIADRSATEGKRNAVIETFEGFTYAITLTPEKDADDKQLMTVTVAAELPKERKKEEDEKPEDAKAKDEAFTTRLKTLTEKLDKEKAFAGRTFEVAKSTVDPLLIERDKLVTKATAAPAPDPSQGSIETHPGGIIATPPVKATATTRPIEAVTPPIAIPPLTDEEKAAIEKKAMEEAGE